LHQKTLNKSLSALGLLSVVLAMSQPMPVQASEMCIQLPTSCRISSKFGPRMHPVLKVEKPHNGTDFACPIGTSVKAAHDGFVEKTYPHHGGGNTVVLMGNGFSTKYLHNYRYSVKTGEKVSVGQEVSKSGNTGSWTTGPHLHFVLEVKGTPKDPMAAICGEGAVSSAGGMSETPPDTSAPGGATTGPSNPGSGAPSIPRFEWETRDGLDGSVWEILGGIISSRALNPDYARQVGLLDETRLYEEFNYLRGVKSRVTFERLQARQRIARNQALINAIRAEARHAKGLDAQRAAAMQSAANR